MKKPFGHFTSLLASLMLIALMSGQVSACLFPSPVKMSRNRPMACCTDHCRMRTTQEEARKSCQQTLVVTGQEQLTAPSSTRVTEAAMKALTDTGLYGYQQARLSPRPNSGFLTNDRMAGPRQSVDLYLLTRSLRI